jgi:FtsH-binding integral membrane protein
MANWSDPRASAAPYAATGAAARTDAYDAGLRSYMLSVYNYMASGVLLTGVVAMLFASSGMAAQVLATPLRWVIMLAPLAFVMVLSFGINRLSTAAAQGLYWAFAVVMGLSLSSIFLVFTGTSIATTFFATAAAFAGLSLYGYTTKRDLSAFGTFLIMGVVGILIASLINLFVQSSGPAAGHQLHRCAAVCGSDRVRHPEDQGDVLSGPGLRLRGQVGGAGGAVAVSRLRQHVHLPAQLHGQPRLSLGFGL